MQTSSSHFARGAPAPPVVGVPASHSVLPLCLPGGSPTLDPARAVPLSSHCQADTLDVILLPEARHEKLDTVSPTQPPNLRFLVGFLFQEITLSSSQYLSQESGSDLGLPSSPLNPMSIQVPSSLDSTS